MAQHFNVTDVGEQLSAREYAKRDAELKYWMEEAQRLARMLQQIVDCGIKGHPVVLHHRDKTVTMVSETTAQRMSGDIP